MKDLIIFLVVVAVGFGGFVYMANTNPEVIIDLHEMLIEGAQIN